MISVYLTGGIHNNRKLISLSSKTRPTSQMVRGAVFNMIDVKNKIILDLFSGSGLYGFEAISRGAKMCYFNDLDNEAYKSVKENAKTLKEEEKSKITKLDYKEFLKRHKDNHFDYIFIDPPYNFTDDVMSDLLDKLSIHKGTLILERDKTSKILTHDNYKITKDKTYGIKRILIYERI
ncbi:MAG: methyltransferase [Acholeplasmataceae bacterium]|nr:methyltransferase [Acholeplasmataceae bacterium]